MSRKRCPACGERFPRSATFCDQDGAALVPEPSPRRRRRRRWIGFAVIATLVGVAALALPAAAGWWLEVQLDVDLVAARFAAAAEADGEEDGGEGGLIGLLNDAGKLAGDLLGVDSRNLVIELRIENRTALPLDVHQARYTVRVAGEPVGTGTWTPPADGDGRCDAGEQLTTTLSITPTAEGALAIAGSLLGRRAPEVEVSGDLEVDFLFARSEVPFHVRGIGLDLAAQRARPSAPAAAPPPGPATASDRPEA